MFSINDFARGSARIALAAAIAGLSLLWGAAMGVAQERLTERQAIAALAADDPVLATFYRARDYQPIWVGEDDRERRRAFHAALAGAADHGLPAARYDAGALRALFEDVRSLRDLGRAEVEASRMFLSYARAVQTGILEPRQVDPGLVLEVPRRDPLELLRAFADADPHEFIRALPPQSPDYLRLLKLKRKLEQEIAAGGWGPAVAETALKPGSVGAGVVALRDRLRRMGYLPVRASASYDGVLESAVRQFQIDLGLTPDGVAGRETIAQINMPAEKRLEQVVVGLERLRWLNKPLGERHILVNQAAFRMYVVDDGRVSFESDVIVGMAAQKWNTPEFSDEMEHLIVNPTWHVPQSIAIRDYLPKLIANPGAAGYLQLYDANGRPVSRANIDFSRYTPATFPYRLKQPPSDDNALGLVKFMFPNRWNIYLHDTPSKHLFGRDIRAFSSGCVRVQRPFELAYELLSRQTADPRGLFQRALDSGRETQIDLETHVPVHLTYRTVWVDAKGRVNYRADVYGRDGRIFAALAAEGVRLPEGGKS